MTREAEILIIGGGIAGAATAFYLARSGRDVALVERGEIASEASGVNAGQIGATGWGDMPDLGSYLTMGSLQLFKEIQLDLGCDIEFRQSGSLTAVHTAEQYEYMRGRVLEMRSHGFEVELLTAREARAIEPEINPALPAYMYTPLRAQADPRFRCRGVRVARAHIHQSRGIRRHSPSRRRLLARDERRRVCVPIAGDSGGRVVRAGGQNAWSRHPHRSGARTDVGDR